MVTTDTAGFTRHSLRNGFNGFLRALPGDEFLFVTVIGGFKVCPSPVGPTRLRRFDISNGCQDHTTSPSASASVVSVPLIAHRPKPALRSPLRAQRCRVHRIPPRVRDDRDTPL